MAKQPDPGLYRTTKPYPGQEAAFPAGVLVNDELLSKLAWAPILPVRSDG